MPARPILRSLKQENEGFVASLGYTTRCGSAREKWTGQACTMRTPLKGDYQDKYEAFISNSSPLLQLVPEA